MMRELWPNKLTKGRFFSTLKTFFRSIGKSLCPQLFNLYYEVMPWRNSSNFVYLAPYRMLCILLGAEAGT